MTQNEALHLAERIKAQIAEGGGFWRTCSGCYETCDGQNVYGYPFSEAFGCILGSGCRECGGLGAVWDTVDYEDFARSMLAEDARAQSEAGQP